jgi:hypothetical protein
MATDAFQAALAARREEIVDPVMRASAEEQTRGLYLRSLEILREKLAADSDHVADNLALNVFRDSGKLLGYGARPPELTQPRETVAESLVKHADNLVALLRKERKVAEGDVIDGQITGEGQSPHLLSGTSYSGGLQGRETAPAPGPRIPGPRPERADGEEPNLPTQTVQGPFYLPSPREGG